MDKLKVVYQKYFGHTRINITTLYNYILLQDW